MEMEIKMVIIKRVLWNSNRIIEKL
jgi:hypothetical protein